MNMLRFTAKFASLPRRLGERLVGFESETVTTFRAECYGIMFRAVRDGQIGPDFMPNEPGYCHVLAVAGYLERRGNRMAPTHYVPTADGRELMNGC